MVVYLEKMLERLNSGEPKIIFRNISCFVIIGLTKKWKKSVARGGGNKKRLQYCTDSSGKIVYLRALQGHSGRNLIDPSLQDNVLIPNGFIEYNHHIGCAINLQNSGLIPGGQNLSKRQTVFFTSVGPMNKEHKDPDVIDLDAPRLAQDMH